MEKTPNYSTFASLLASFILILLPLMSCCKEETYKSLSEIKQECCIIEDAELKRFNDIDYDSFVSLMGRRSAAQPKRHIDHKLVDLLGQKKRTSLPCVKECLQTKERFINHGRQRVQRNQQ